ncbi:MAG: CPA2 family monovalent cation:H+ antiporter-2 [Verrucomicrobiales bacterium]|jgi:CPA2 family monovalent cation:H+ antiporter-2
MIAVASDAQIWAILLQIVALLGVALLLGVVFERLKQSAILGYLLAGTILGPFALDFVRADSGVPIVAELGVSLLLFAIGLEFSLKRLMRLGAMAVGGGSLQVVLTLLAGAGIAVLTGFEIRTALAIGAIVALSSTACVLRILTDRTQLDSVHGRSALGVLLLQDVAVVPLVLLVTMLGGAGSAFDMALGLGKALGLIVVLLAAFWWISNQFLPRLLKEINISRDRELLILLAAVLALGSACAAHALDLSPALGAFIAGMLLAESPFATQVRADVGAMRALFVTLFFTSVGMLGDPQWILENALLVLGVVVLIILGKSILITLLALIFKRTLAHAIATGIALAQVGEFGVVIAGIAASSQLIDESLLKLLVSSTLISLFLTPFLVRSALPIGESIERLAFRLGIWRHEHQKSKSAAAEHHEPTKDHVIVAGFGPAGRQAGEELLRDRQAAIVLDLRPPNVELARTMGLDAALGDATNPDVLIHHGIEHAKALVISIPDHNSIVRVVQTVRHLAPTVQIIARARYHAFVPDLELAGATVVVDEEALVGRRLAVALRAIVGKQQAEPED